MDVHRNFAPSLPYEIIEEILSYFPHDQSSQPILRTCTLISRAWYSATIARLYQHPRITGPNYKSFVNAVCPSINAHIRKNGLSELVRTLDLGALVHHGSKSLTGRLLGRVKDNIEVFVAPQASFGVNALAPLSKCLQLRDLDLSLVSEAFTPSQLMHTLPKLKSLETLHFPRAGKERYEVLYSCWPHKLRRCTVTGGLTSENRNLYNFPPRQQHNLTHLTIGNCGTLWASHLEDIVSEQYLPKLEYLCIRPHMFVESGPEGSEMPRGSKILSKAAIRHLRIPSHYLRAMIRDSSARSIDKPYKLDTLELDAVDAYPAFLRRYIDTDMIWDAVAEGPLGNLRRLWVHSKSYLPGVRDRDRQEFNEYLKALAREDGNKARFTEDQAGMQIFN